MPWPVRKTTTAKKKKNRNKPRKPTTKPKIPPPNQPKNVLLSLQIFQRGLFPIPGRCWGSLYSPPKPHVGIAPCSKHEGYGSQEEEEKSCVGNNYAELRLPLVQWWKQKQRCPSVERHQPGPASFLGRGGGNFFFLVWNASWLCVSPCVGAMLIFSVWVQFWCMCCWSEHSFVF